MHTGKFEGFDIEVHAEEEHDDPKGHFASGDKKADEEMVRRIRNGDFLWFTARVTASKEGIVLGNAYLGGCCYVALGEFVDTSGYYEDMRREAVDEAKAKLRLLAA